MKTRRPHLILYFAATIAALGLGTAILFACSSNDNGSATSLEAGQDSPAAPQRDAPTADDSAVDDAGVTCSPHPVSAPFTWHPPKPFNPAACTPSQIDGYLQSCLSSSRAVCDAFRQQNPGCAACVYTSADEPSWGPVVDYRDDNWDELNAAGCLALVKGEKDETGCGGAFEAYDECTLQSCGGCLPVKGSSKQLTACLSDPQVDTICASSLAQANVKCSKNGDPRIQQCNYADPSFQVNARAFVTFWCSTVDDGGADGGDADAN